MRAMVEGIIYRYRRGIAWRDVPEVFGEFALVYRCAVVLHAVTT
ncbi:transposase [Amycolatopsis sp. NPDC051903]